MTDIVVINTAAGPDLVKPTPLEVAASGAIGQQHLWQGEAVEVLGFTDRYDRFEVLLDFEDFWAAPRSAIGAYPVLRHADGTIHNGVTAVESVLLATR